MKNNIIFIMLVAMQFYDNSTALSTTMKISERIRLLKKQIRHSLRNPPPEDEPAPVYYESDENAPIKPILNNDALKKDDKFKLKQVKTYATPPTPHIEAPKFLLRTKPTSKLNSRLQNMLMRLKFSVKTTGLAKPTVITKTPIHIPNSTNKLSFNIFYRRAYDKSILEAAQEWMHCSEHVTPYLKGVKKALARPHKVQDKDDIVHRLLVLLRANTTKMTRAEKKTNMYQISKLRIRLYSWSLNAKLKLIGTLAAIGGSMKIDFTSIRRGLLKLLATWQADLSNTTVLLYQAKVFRPPCIPRGDQGSSKFVRGSTISSPATPERLVEECDGRRDENDNCIIS